jgi:hypothetical protein
MGFDILIESAGQVGALVGLGIAFIIQQIRKRK